MAADRHTCSPMEKIMKTILVVDDDPDMRKLATIILTKEGYTIIEAEDGSLALDLVKEKKPDLIISDVMMENVNGFMLYELLHDDPSTTEHSDHFCDGRGAAGGGVGFKPERGVSREADRHAAIDRCSKESNGKKNQLNAWTGSSARPNRFRS